MGAASSKAGDQATVTLDVAAAALAAHEKPFKFGCVTIAERHLAKNREHENILRKMDAGAKWFISQVLLSPKKPGLRATPRPPVQR